MSTPLEQKELVKPPIGLRPRNIAEYYYAKERINEIEEAIVRYTEAGSDIPSEWIEEYNELNDSLLTIPY